MGELINEHMWHDWQHNTNIVFSLTGVFVVLLVMFFTVSSRRRYVENYLSTSLILRSAEVDSNITSEQRGISGVHDTIFILPDISHYTRFMAHDHFADQTAQFVIFSLINAMIKAASKTLELSKVEGDAVLFFVDAEKHSKQVMGATLVDIFNAFDIERERLMASNLCSCKACPKIKMLDIKIFVHRGKTTRFKFRGSIDHFGQELIVLHRMMKNSISSDRYALITDLAAESIEFSEELHSEQLKMHIDDIGCVNAKKYEFTEQKIRNWPVVNGENMA